MVGGLIVFKTYYIELLAFDVFFLMFLFVFLGCVFGACCAYFPYLVGSVELFVVFFVFNLKYIRCL